ncbi:hypothetical protein V3C99_019048, partial [Haemonchus contortus]
RWADFRGNRGAMPILKVPTSELNLKAVLLNGQSFRWRSIDDSFYGVIDGLLLHLKRVDDDNIEWSCLGRVPNAEEINIAQKLHDYFQLDVILDNLWDTWSSEDTIMAELRNVKELHGIRILKQDPFETLLAFICSTNNNIPRISSMVNRLAKLYGDPITLDPSYGGAKVIDSFPELGHAFPTLSQLSDVQDVLEDVLREGLFGYRAKSISETVRKLSTMPSTCLEDVQNLNIDEIREFLLGFAGVGPKVAECVALMSLRQNQCVPIDRHVFEITKKYYLPELKDSNLTNTLSRRLTAFYEEKFGKYAGWTQAVLFNQQLEKFVQTPSKEKKVKRDAVNNGKINKNVPKKPKQQKRKAATVSA